MSRRQKREPAEPHEVAKLLGRSTASVMVLRVEEGVALAAVATDGHPMPEPDEVLAMLLTAAEGVLGTVAPQTTLLALVADHYGKAVTDRPRPQPRARRGGRPHR